jgi:ribonucleoside-diphosphate reductase beta chain
MTIFNKERKYGKDIKQQYPLFLGESLSLSDGIDVTYPQLENLIFKQRANFWTEKSVDMEKDRTQFPTLPSNVQDISVLNLAWQSQADSIAGRAPIAALMPFVTNPELEELLNYWQLFESIHSRTYQHIIKTVFHDPEVIRDRVANLEQSMDRLEIISVEFTKLESMGAAYTLCKNEPEMNAVFNMDKPEVKKAIYAQIIRSVGALYAMESVQFMASFACTFALANQKVLTGTCDQVKKIAKDEKLHISFSKAILDILANDPETAEIYKENLPYLQEVLDATVKAEYKWADYLFSEGRQVIGLNAVLTKEYLDYLATKAYVGVGLEYGNPTTDHPINWVESYLNPEKVQVAPQERDVTNYTIGSVKNDLGQVNVAVKFKATDFMDEGCMGLSGE